MTAKNADSCNEDRVMKRDLFLIQEINQLKREDAVRVMYDALEGVLNALRTMTVPGAYNVQVDNAGFGQYKSDK